MKKTLFLLLLAPFCTVAQSSNSAFIGQYINRMAFLRGESVVVDFNGLSDVLTPAQCQQFGVQKITVERGRKKGKLTKTEYELTDLGFIERIQKPNESLTYTYINDSLVSSIRETGKTDYTTNYEYIDGKLKKKEVFKEDKLRSRLMMEYENNEKVSFCLLQTGRKLRTSYAMSYDYADAKLRKQELMRNDRTVRVWDFNCDPKGEEVSEKNLSTLCKVREENNDGSYVDHIRKVENGEIFLYTHYFNKDAEIYKSTCEKESGEKVSEMSVSGNDRTYVDYAKNGEIKRKQIIKYNEEGKVLESSVFYGRKQQKVSKSIYTYNEQGLILEASSFYKGKQTYFKKYSYVS